ncbi:MAG: FAD-binding oxidoreductase [Candidatus Dormibacter sp.]
MTGTTFAEALRAFRDAVGAEHVLESVDALLPYAVNVDPAGDVPPAAVVQPGSVDEVRTVVAAANRCHVSIYPLSAGRNHGLGMASAVDPGNVIVDLRRMNRIVEVDEELAFAVVEPGVTFIQMHRFLLEHKLPLWVSPTSGPVDGSLIGNALDKGAGYTPYGDHFFNLCGMEVVLSDGRLVRTGDAAAAGVKTGQTHRWGSGPILDGLFVQSNFGVVVRAGVWLMPAPPDVRTFAVLFPDDDDIHAALELTRALKLRGPVPGTISIPNDLFALGHLPADPTELAGGRRPLTDGDRRDARARYQVGAWNLVGAIYGGPGALDLSWASVQKAVSAYPAARLLPHDEVVVHPAFAYRVDIASGIPNEQELQLYKIRPNGGSLYFLPAIRLRGDDGLEVTRINRRILPQFGFDYTIEYLCAPRSVRATQPIIYDTTDPAQRTAAISCYGRLLDEFAAAGYLVSRPNTLFQDRVMASMPELRDVALELKRALDPNGILAPGRYGLRVRATDPGSPDGKRREAPTSAPVR